MDQGGVFVYQFRQSRKEPSRLSHVVHVFSMLGIATHRYRILIYNVRTLVVHNKL